MVTRVQAPQGTETAHYMGEDYKADADGYMNVPDALAAILTESHGFIYPDRPAPAPDAPKGFQPRRPLLTVVSDDEPVEDDEPTADSAMPDMPSPEVFSAPMTQKDMKNYLREHDVAIPKGITVGDLRKLVHDTYVAEWEKAHAPPSPVDPDA